MRDALSAAARAILNRLTPASPNRAQDVSNLPERDRQHIPLSGFPNLRALSQAPFATAYPFDATCLVPGDEFFEENPLIAASIKPATQQRYSIALDNFKNSRTASDDDNLSIDQRLAIYIQDRFLQDPRAGQRQEMANLVCILLLMYPNLRQQLGLARRCLAGWKALKPSKSAVPLTKELVFAFAWHLFTTQKQQSAGALLLSFGGCLRVSETLNLTWGHVALPGDIRLASYGPDVAAVNIKDAKTARVSGRLQFV